MNSVLCFFYFSFFFSHFKWKFLFPPKPLESVCSMVLFSVFFSHWLYTANGVFMYPLYFKTVYIILTEFAKQHVAWSVEVIRKLPCFFLVNGSFYIFCPIFPTFLRPLHQHACSICEGGRSVYGGYRYKYRCSHKLATTQECSLQITFPVSGHWSNKSQFPDVLCPSPF